MKVGRRLDVLVYGAGAVGSYLGALLCAAGHRVCLLGRPAHVRAIVRGGLRVEREGSKPEVVRPLAAARLAEAAAALGRVDLLLLTVKGYDVDRALREIESSPECSRGAFLTLQNGIGHEEAVAGAVGSERVVAGSLTISASLPEPGRVVQHTETGGLGLAPVGDETPVKIAADAFARAGIDVREYSDYRDLKWSKLLLNMIANAVPAVLGMTPLEVLSDPAAFSVEKGAFREACRVMSAIGVRPVDLPGFPVRLARILMLYPPGFLARLALAPAAGSSRGEKAPSLQMDLESGKGRSEVVFLNGAVADRGRRAGVPAPVNAFLCDVVAGLASGELPRSRYLRRPDRLARDARRFAVRAAAAGGAG